MKKICFRMMAIGTKKAPSENVEFVAFTTVFVKLVGALAGARRWFQFKFPS